ncbi:fimbria/pilus periplasmic chaperone [Escherichia coli]
MKGLLSLLIFLWSFLHMPELLSTGRALFTRQKNKEVMVQLMNRGNRSSLLQAWIDDGDTSLPPEKNSGSFHVNATSGKKIGANSGQQVKIKNYAE